MQKKRLFTILAILTLCQLALPAQEASTAPQEDIPASQPAQAATALSHYPPALSIQGELAEGAVFTTYLLLTSNTAITLEASVVLKDTAKQLLFPAASLQLSDSIIRLEANKALQLSISATSPPEPGNYKGTLVLNGGQGKRWNIPLTVRVRQPTEASIYETDKSPVANTADWSFLNFLLPRSIRQQGISLRIDNKGSEALVVSSASIALKGEKSNQPMTGKMFQLDTANIGKEVAAHGLESLLFHFNNQVNQLPPDTYKGEFRIFFKDNPTPLSTSVTVNKRMGALLALFLLLLGILVGRWIKDLTKAKGQLELMERFLPLRAKVDRMKDEIAQKALLDELEKLETDINGVFSDEAKGDVEKKFPPIEQKVERISQLENSIKRLDEALEGLQLKVEKVQFLRIRNEAYDKVRALRDAILFGDEEAVKSSSEALEEFLKNPAGEGSKDALGGLINLLPEGKLKEELKALAAARQTEGGGEGDGPGKPSTIQKAVIWVLNKLSGVEVTARVRYGLMRPIVTLATFIVILLLGFNEIYIDGGDTFGSEGFLDYLKLFLWGIISDVFSRSLTDIEAVKSFMGKQ